ncbi:hypothetical protein K458DRAFT_417289 [Lentithecium fluviatile CBS 122367]|uniref:Uncharacterized protein n=1 Tax=Lentithecium fluviatile CBS 122367 TaxID=1168545 RepID=A0A6G1J481_9PLEO|nr:hypothetical protein K458DRAFT_417289 [Lentithecium fluviatile CBS 122367]
MGRVRVRLKAVCWRGWQKRGIGWASRRTAHNRRTPRCSASKLILLIETLSSSLRYAPCPTVVLIVLSRTTPALSRS